MTQYRLNGTRTSLIKSDLKKEIVEVSKKYNVLSKFTSFIAVENVITNYSGELIYEGPNVCLGYSNSFKDLSLESKNNNILHTGDIATKDKENFFYIVGRLKRIAKIFRKS